MAKKFQNLREKMSPSAQKKAASITKALLKKMRSGTSKKTLVVFAIF